MDGVAARINARAPKGRKDLKPKTHHFFYVLVWLAGWIAPPVAVLIRFGIGRDFFINILMTICGYFPGHFHNFYCQTIRNNKTAARTPKWAIKYGLVEVQDKRGGKHQWASRYDERLPDSSRHGYADGDSSSSLPAGEWDGQGPEPERSSGGRRQGGSGRSGFHLSAPWDRVVDDDEVEGGRPSSIRSGRSGRAGNGGNGSFDPIDNEQFYASNDHSNLPDSSSSQRKSKKGVKGFLKNRDRYENPSPAPSADRFDKMKAARPQDDYQDDFERELNSGRGAATGAAAPSSNRFDDFEQEGPEDAWATKPRTTNNSGSASEPARTSNNGGDGDLFKHTF